MRHMDCRLLAGAAVLVLTLCSGAAAHDDTAHGSSDIPDAPAVVPAPPPALPVPAPSIAPAPAAPPAMPQAPAPVAAGPRMSVTAPIVQSVDATMSDADLRDVLEGNFAAHASQLAALDATSIKVPKLEFVFEGPARAGNDTGVRLVYDYENIDLEGIKNGVVHSVSVGGFTGRLTGPDAASPIDLKFKLGGLSAGNMDLGATLEFYGLLKTADSSPKTLYSDFRLDGGTFTTAQGGCAMGPITGGSFSARPLKTSFLDIMKLVQQPGFNSPHPPVEDIGKLLSFYADFFSAIRIDPVTLSGFTCSGKDDKGQPVAVSIDSIAVGALANGIYPEATEKGIRVVASDGSVGLDSVTLKKIDFSGPITAIETAGVPLTQQWFMDNARKLIPSFGGFSLAGLKIDAPDEQNPTQRIKATLAGFDLSLKDYFGGIPTTITSSARHFVMPIPAAAGMGEDDFAELRPLGIKTLDLGYDLATHRDVPGNGFVVDKAAVEAAGLGSVDLAATLGNVGDALFTGGAEAAEAAAMATTLKTVKVDIADAGLGDLAIKLAAAQQGMDPGTARTSFANMAQGLVLVGLAGNPDANGLAAALGKFIGGGKSLSVTVTSRDPAGLNAADFEAAQADPKVLAAKVGISASAQ